MRTSTWPGAKEIVFFLALIAAFLGLGLGPDAAKARGTRYVCVPCGLPCDAKTFDRPGTCPDCGMKLVTEEEAKAAAAESASSKKVAILVFNGAEIIDFTGPYEIFGAAGFDVYSVARTKDPVTTAMGLTIVPKYSFEDVPLPDVLLVPGGGVRATQNDTATLRWITEETAKIQHTISVCNGAFILASAGLLDGLSATTTDGNIPRMRKEFPNVHVVGDQRYVDNGKIITTAGLSAGIDGALHVVELLMGKGAAEQTALVEEYDWKGNSNFVRAALADKLIPNLFITPDWGAWDVVSTEGNRDHWEFVAKGKSTRTRAELEEHVDQDFVQSGTWKKSGGGSDGTSRWKQKTPDGKWWNGSVTVSENPEVKGELTLRIVVAKAG